MSTMKPKQKKVLRNLATRTHQQSMSWIIEMEMEKTSLPKRKSQMNHCKVTPRTFYMTSQKVMLQT